MGLAKTTVQVVGGDGDVQARLFENLAASGHMPGFAGIDTTAGDDPGVGTGAVAHQQHGAVGVDDDDPHAP